MLAIKLATSVGNFGKRFLEGTFVSYWIGELFQPILMVAIVQTNLARFFRLLSRGVHDYPWEIVGMGFVTNFTKSSEFHWTTIIDSCLPSEMAHFLLCHEKSPQLLIP